MMNKLPRSFSKTSSLLDHILTNWKESMTQNGFITLEISDLDVMFCNRKTVYFKLFKDNTILVKTHKNFSKN